MTKKSVSHQLLCDILTKFKSILAFSTDRANQLVFLIPENGKLTIKKMRFSRVKGFDYKQGRLAVMADRNLMIYDSFNLRHPKLTQKIHLEKTKTHDLQIVDKKVFYCNTERSLISCFPYKTKNQQPTFVPDDGVEDCCHLNGLMIKNSTSIYITCLAKCEKVFGWRKDLTHGILYDLTKQRELLTGLHLPHSPRIYKNQLYFLESNKGEFSVYQNKKKKVIVKTKDFVRGLFLTHGLAFVGVSAVRANKKIDVKSKQAGVLVVDLKKKNIIARIPVASFDEIYDIKLIPISEIYGK